jgi:hypothetical protein
MRTLLGDVPPPLPTGAPNAQLVAVVLSVASKYRRVFNCCQQLIDIYSHLQQLQRTNDQTPFEVHETTCTCGPNAMHSFCLWHHFTGCAKCVCRIRLPACIRPDLKTM